MDYSVFASEQYDAENQKRFVLIEAMPTEKRGDEFIVNTEAKCFLTRIESPTIDGIKPSLLDEAKKVIAESIVSDNATPLI